MAQLSAGKARDLLRRAFGPAIALACGALCAWTPAPARAGWTAAGSLGLGVEVSPQTQVQAGNLMGSIGYEFLGIVRPELGVLGAVETARGSQGTAGGLEFRPMVVVRAPMLPLYLRGVVSGVDLFAKRRRTVAYGGALGVQFGLMHVNLFAEAGVLPRSLHNGHIWVVEARAGLLLELT